MYSMTASINGICKLLVAVAQKANETDDKISILMQAYYRPGCSKLIMSLVNVSLKFPC